MAEMQNRMMRGKRRFIGNDDGVIVYFCPACFPEAMPEAR